MLTRKNRKARIAAIRTQLDACTYAARESMRGAGKRPVDWSHYRHTKDDLDFVRGMLDFTPTREEWAAAGLSDVFPSQGVQPPRAVTGGGGR